VTDIVERLRVRAGPPTQAPYADGTLWREAADEIERLREELATCRELRSLVNGDLVVARVEIARLRDLLHKAGVLRAMGSEP
jgi:hypothetical protein